MGPPESGKSSTAESLKNQMPVLVEKRTRVADFRTWNISPTDTVHIYDEGGQDIYKVTAPVFNTANSVPLLMHNSAKVGSDQLEETSQILRETLQHHPENQVTAVLTHIDLLDKQSLERNTNLN